MRSQLTMLIAVVAIATPVFAQFPEDALRLASPGLGIGPRAVGMGGAFLPIANDYTALYWNPAGLAEINAREITVGFSNAGYSNSVDFLGQSSSSSVNSMQLDHFGVVIPMDRHIGGLSLAVGYNRLNNFSAIASFEGVNPNSSLVGYTVKNTYGDPTLSLPYLTGVAGIVNGKLVTPVAGGLTQSGTYNDDGGLHAFSLGAGFNLAEGLDLGVAVHFYSGTYTYGRKYQETDKSNLYNALDTVNWTNVDLYQYAQNDNVDASISGIGATFGILYHWLDLGAFGLTVALPSSYHVHEDYSQTGAAAFDDGFQTGNVTQSGFDEYDVTTPMTVSGGFAIHPIHLFTISASADYIDYTQLRFSNTDQSVLDYNSEMNTLFRPVVNYHFGAEYKIAPLGIGVRAGYQFLKSAWAVDASGDGQKILSGGVSFLLAKKALLELTVAHDAMKAYHTNYDESSATTESVSLTTVMLGFSYRY